MKTVLDPESLFLSDFDWQDPEKRDLFLQHLLDNLENINTYQITKIYWTDNLEELLWESPQLPPWRLDRDWNLRIVQIIYKVFNDVKECVKNDENLSPCLVEPAFNCNCSGELALSFFLELMHILIEKGENTYLCLGINRNREEYSFSCNCHESKIDPLLIAKPIEWLNHIKLTVDYWPQNPSEVEKLNQIVNIIFKKTDRKALFEYEFTPSFVKDIARSQRHRECIIDAIAKRLALTKQEAAKDPYLQDEYLTQKREYRFRVTQRPFSTRIHYKYVNKKLRFLRYYDEGEHDDGL